MQSHLIRIAVTASLIVACVVQPLAVIASAGVYDPVDLNQQMVCAGCGCCEISAAEQHCCCCSSEPEQESKRTIPPQLIAVDQVETCHCGVSTPPADRSNDRQRNAKLMQLRSIAKRLAEILPAIPPQPRQLTESADHGVRQTARFSQRHLSIWLI